MIEVDIFDVEEKCAFLCISVGLYRLWMRKHGCVSIQLQEDFRIPKTILKF